MTVVLEADRLSKSFGGVKATREVSFAVAAGTVHAIIGPNGAGKTTLIAQLFGELAPDAGRVVFCGRDITNMPPQRRARLGLSRSFQITTLAGELTVHEHVVLRLLAERGHGFRFLRPVAAEHVIEDEADAILAEHGLWARAHSLVSDLSHGEQRTLELALAIAVPPRLVLLDEPMAGLGAGEGHAFIDRLTGLKGRFAILLVEHDMSAVFELADIITVLVEGRVAAEGPPDAIRADETVRRVYLGEP